MDIKDDHLYTIKEGVKLTGILHRTLTRKASKLGATKIDGRFLLSGHQIKELIKKQARKQAHLDKLDSQALDSLDKRQEKKTEKINEAEQNYYVEIEKNKLIIAELKSELSLREIERKEMQGLKDLIEKQAQMILELKNQLKDEIPHQVKLKNAIQLITLEALDQGVMHKIFTDEEYNDIIGTISEVDFQKEQVQYLRGRVEKQDEVLKKLVQQTSERNYIEAKEKGFDKE